MALAHHLYPKYFTDLKTLFLISSRRPSTTRAGLCSFRNVGAKVWNGLLEKYKLILCMLDIFYIKVDTLVL